MSAAFWMVKLKNRVSNRPGFSPSFKTGFLFNSFQPFPQPPSMMVSIDGQPYSSLPQQERNNNDSIVPPSGQVKLHSKQMPIRGEALLEEKKKGNVPYRVPGLVAVLRKSKEAIDKSFILYYINLYYI